MPIVVVFLFFLITLTGSSNAINLTDGLDGLAIGCTVTVALTYAIMAYASGNFLISDYLKISWVPGTESWLSYAPRCWVEVWHSYGIMLILRKCSWATRALWLSVV